MKTPLLPSLAVVVVLTSVAVAQSACRQAPGQVIERGPGFTIQKVTLPSDPNTLDAKAIIPNTPSPAGAVVFSFSTLSDRDGQHAVKMLPLAIEMVKHGSASVVIQRKLTWPAIEPSVGTIRASVLCAEQWLSTHASVQPANWGFVGPSLDVPSFEQLHAVGDSKSMTFAWSIPLGGPNENENTERNLLDSSLLLRDLLSYVKPAP